MEDKKIVELYFARDELAIAETQKKYGALLFGIAKRILGADIDAEECLNDALLGTWNSIPPADPDNLRAYVCKIIRNLSIKRLDYNLAEKRSVNSEISLDELETVLPDGDSGNDLERIDLSILLDGFLRTLTPETRAIFVRRYFFFDSISDIAADIGMSKGSVKTSLWRTRSKFKEYLQEKGSCL